MGFHPDAGASFYLSRLPGYLGNVYINQVVQHFEGVNFFFPKYV